MEKKVCPEAYKKEGSPDRHCVLKQYHSGYCQDETGFKFYIEYLSGGSKVYWPDFLGNGPNGYPMNNKAFDEAAKKSLDERKQDLEDAENFLKAMEVELRKRVK